MATQQQQQQQHSFNELLSHRAFLSLPPAKSLQSCPTLCDPIDGSPPGSPIAGILQAKVLEWGAISFSAGLITSWQIYGETMEMVTDTILGDSKITEGSDYSHEIKRRLLLGRKAMKNLDSVLKSRDIALLTKLHIVKAMIFPIVMYG